MKNKILKAIETFNMLENSRNITVALSGGADSMCLLYSLISLRDELQLNIRAIHINHLIRGEEAFSDEEFVKNTCDELNIPLICERIDVPSIAKTEKISIELAARKARYEIFSKIKNSSIATAHTSNDNLETLILNITRGTSLKGLSSIPPKRDNIIRPLIYCTRADIEDYCSKNSIKYVTDSTNLSDDYTRNLIRHKIIPILESINPSVQENTVKMCEFLRNDYLFLENNADLFLKTNLKVGYLDLSGFSALNKSVALLVLNKFISSCNPSIVLNSVHLENIYFIALNGGKTSLPKNFSAISRKNRIFIKENNLIDKNFSVKTEKIENFSFYDINVNNLLLNNLLDYDKIAGELIIRTRKAGDRMRPIKRGITKTLKSLFNEAHIPLEERKNLPVISDNNGVIFIHKIGVASRCRVDEKTKTALLVLVD